MNNIWENPVLTKLRAGESVFAATVTTGSMDSAVALAGMGFDFLWVEMEHSPITLESLRGIVLATRGLPATVIARVPVVEMWTAKRVLDQGVTGVIFPFTSTPDLAARAAAACRYPPVGLRGSGAGLATMSWPEPGSYYDSADANIVTIAVIEQACAVERIDEIAATPGIDVLFIGSSDLSFSFGYRGRQEEPVLLDAIQKIADAARRHNKFLGRPAANAEQVRAFQRQGFQLFQCTTELGLMALGAERLLAPLGITGISREQRSLY